MQADKRLDLLSVASIPLIMTLGNSMLIPILPMLQQQLDVTAFQTSLIITVYSAVAIVLIPIAGFLSDCYGRKIVIIPSLIIAAAGGLISVLAALLSDNSYVLILIGRMLQGVGAAGCAPIVLPLIGDMFRSEDDVSTGLGIVETSNTFGKVLSPILGAYLSTVVWYLPFLAIPIFCGVSILLVWFLLKSPKQKPKNITIKSFTGDIKSIFRQKGRWLYAIFAIGAICMFIVFGVLFYLSSLLEKKYGIDGVIKGLILAIPLGSLCLSSYLTGRFVGENKRMMKWVTFFGLVILAVAIFATGFFKNIYLIVLSLFVSGVGIGMTLPCLDAFITEGIEKAQRGTITSMFSSMRFIGVALGPPLVSILMDISQLTLFLTFAGLSLLAAVLSLFAIKPRSKGKKGEQKDLLDIIIKSMFNQRRLEKLK
ncbi:MFS transporter [Brevibacillus dissolubilis]|uniref:MFS transporter n=1 Tax=Brevibacillus dissolubilis TaxID=1844116 RepID=UPI0011173817|nr:MFS transporter [Brevibacillus dissolubilis]